MTLARLLVCVSVLSVFTVGVVVAVAREAPPVAPATTQAASQPTTAPATQPTHAVKKGRLSLKVDAAGTFLPADPVEVRIRPEAYQGELKVVAAAANGAAVKKGDVLLQIDPADLNRQLDAARNEFTAAKANHAKAESDVKLGETADALATRMTENAAKKAEADLKWWDDLIGPQTLERTDLGLKQMAAGVEDQADELDQLRKMYKTEDLTSATADIVIKRAVRQYEISKVQLAMQQASAKKVKEFDHPESRKPLEYAAEQGKQALEQLKVAQAHGKVTRQTALKGAQLALAAAEKKVADLEKDLAQLTAVAPADGVVLYGQLNGEGALQPADPRTLRPAEKIPAGQTVMVLFTPGVLRVGFDLPESKLAWVKPGMRAKVTPVAWPELSYEGSLAPPPVVGKLSGAEQAFMLSVDLSNVDPRIRPGMKAAVKVDAGQGDEFPLAPVAAVNGGKVKVRTKDGKEEEREVVTGRSDGQQVEIRQGVQEGEEILAGAKS